MLAIAIILTIMLLAVIYFDATRLIIPNELNLGFIIIYPLYLMLSPEHVDWPMSLAVMAGFFVVGYLIFLANVMGGGDIKLLIALSLWIGWQPETLSVFGLWTALLGGVLAIILIIIRLTLSLIQRKRRTKLTLPEIFQPKQPMPYGLAISSAFALLLWTKQIFNFGF